MKPLILCIRHTCPRFKTIGLWLSLASAIITVGGCSSEYFKKMAYTLSTSYSCIQSNKHLPNKTLKDLECSNPVKSKEMSYEEYKKQRQQLLKRQD